MYSLAPCISKYVAPSATKYLLRIAISFYNATKTVAKHFWSHHFISANHD